MRRIECSIATTQHIAHSIINPYIYLYFKYIEIELNTKAAWRTQIYYKCTLKFNWSLPLWFSHLFPNTLLVYFRLKTNWMLFGVQMFIFRVFFLSISTLNLDSIFFQIFIFIFFVSFFRAQAPKYLKSKKKVKTKRENS